MPAISIDTFFACSLTVLLVLSAMTATAKLLQPLIASPLETEAAKRYGEIAKYMMLNVGKPFNWGQNSQTFPEEFGLAEANAQNPYVLDVDKVSRLNSESLYALSYAQIFTILKVSDVSFRLEIKPLFDVGVNLTATFENVDETVYEFEVVTEKSGAEVPTDIKFYVVAEDFLQASNIYNSDGRRRFNATIPNSVNGPALLVVFAKSAFNAGLSSFAAYAFAHNSSEPASRGNFLRLSPLNYTLTVLPLSLNKALSTAYALTFNYAAKLTQIASDNQTATFSIPRFADASPTVLVVTGWNSTRFFVEWTAYPQIPLEIGVDFTKASSLSDVFAYDYLVTIGSAIYKCTVWLGGPKT
ncbi:MAG: hypothetical protein QHH12_04175 [Candidatus Bathyarchaeota archaeon]|jgi:hypothetical protein|nr:hypothetical protein [Candidatus Bathyarchaeota archaeon A05DMB-3]MDH7606948.1 hypothetical protein [Candidatus Bathyarchaeota archaeon]